MSGWQPTKGKAAAIGGVQHWFDDDPAQKNACCEKASDTPERRPQEAHGRIGRSRVRLSNGHRLCLSAAA